MPRFAPDGTIFFVTRIAPTRFVDIATTPHNPAPRFDPFLQIGINEAACRTSLRQPWELVIYHQGYRAGFLSLNVSLSSLDTTTTSDENEKSKYAFVAM